MNPRDLPQAWREQAEHFRQLGAAGQACTFEHCAKKLEATLESYQTKALSLAEAARESGYSKDGLARLVRERKIPNVGRKNAPRIRRRDLPRKPNGDVLCRAEQVDSKEQIARSIVNTCNGGHDD